jgi:hypothetical protein
LLTNRQPTGSPLAWLSWPQGRTTCARTPRDRGHVPSLRGFLGSRGRPSRQVSCLRGLSPKARATADPGGRCPLVSPPGREALDLSLWRAAALRGAGGSLLA